MSIIDTRISMVSVPEVHNHTIAGVVVLAAFGFWNEEKAPSFREGVKYFEDKGTDIFLITLNKSDKDFSPSTLYEDYAMNERLFHWQTQSRISEETKTAQMYIHQKQLDNRIALFVRVYKEENIIRLHLRSSVKQST